MGWLAAVAPRPLRPPLVHLVALVLVASILVATSGPLPQIASRGQSPGGAPVREIASSVRLHPSSAPLQAQTLSNPTTSNGFWAGPAVGQRETNAQNQYSDSWGGYVQCVTQRAGGACAPGNSTTPGDRQVYGFWQTTAVGSTVAQPQAGLTFVAIGGFGSADFVAAGVSAAVGPAGSTVFSAWWELAPDPAVNVSLSPSASISVGDHVTADVRLSSVLPNGTQFWTFAINDSTTSSTWTGTEACYPADCRESSFDSAEWIEGAPTEGGISTEIPAFPQFPITGEYLENGSGTWVDPQGGTRVLLENLSLGSGDLVYTIGVLNVEYGGSEFWVGYLFDTIPPVYGENCCSLNVSTAGPGRSIGATIDLWTADDFNGSGPTRLALELELWNGSATCYDPTNASVGFLGLGGDGPYASRISVCHQLPSGQFSVQYLLYYTPTGVEAGASGSFLLATSGASVFSKVAVVDFTPDAPTVSVRSGELDDGMSFNLSDLVSVFGTITSGFAFSFPGAPASCSGPFASPAPEVTVRCTAHSSGALSIRATVTVLGISEQSPSALMLGVNAPLVVSVTESSARVEANGTVQFLANASGGDGVYTYDWSELPLGCTAGSTPLVYCTPALFGNYTVSVNVSDGSGAPGVQANTQVEVALPLVVLLFMNYSTAPIGTSLQFLGGAGGGYAPYAYSWDGLPPGCSGINASRLTCTPTAAGTYHVRLLATDALGANASSTIEFNVSAGAGIPGILGLSLLGTIVVFGGLGVAILVAIVLVIRRRGSTGGAHAPPRPARVRPPPPP